MQNQYSWLSRRVKGWCAFLAGLMFITILFNGYVLYHLPNVKSLPSIQWPLPIYIYTREGELMAEIGPRRHQAIKITDVPVQLREAFFAVEDKRFFSHRGVDIRSLLRAGLELLTTGRKSQGGSTITMQMARNYYLTREKTFLRKLREIYLALKIERVFTKEQILELYLNKIYMGHRTFGIGAASQFYFKKSLEQLSLAEMALLAGMPQAPAVLNPITNLEAARKRRDFVLYRMYYLRFISEEDYQHALTEAILLPTLAVGKPSLWAPYAADMAQEAFQKILPQNIEGGCRIYTTLDSRSQRLADEAILTSLLEYDQHHGYRGPEKRLGSLKPPHIRKVSALLKRLPIVNGLQPVVIMASDAERIIVLLGTGDSVIVGRSGWDWILKDKQESIHHHLKQGDIIRIYQQDNAWRLGQLPQVQAALVALDPKNGAIKAVSGGFSYTLSQFNRVTQAARQTGSSFKPFIYAAAFEKGYNLSDVFNDAPLVFDLPGKTGPWRPQNVSQSFYGMTRLRVALVTSVNLATIRLLQAIGIPYALQIIKRFGFDIQKFPNNLSLALGSIEATPLEMARGYATFANGGYRITPYLIDHITDDKGHLVYQANPPRVPALKEEAAFDSDVTLFPNKAKLSDAPKVISDEVAFLITSALKGVIPYSGLHIAKKLGRSDLAGKTGTTNNTVDNWFIGYHSDWICCSVWMGYDKRRPLNEYAYTTALPLWVRFVKPILQGTPVKPFIRPSGVVISPMHPDTGIPAERASSDTLYEYFQKATLDRYRVSMALNQSTQSAQSSQEPLF